MFREYEVVMWSCFTSPQQVNNLVGASKNLQEQEKEILRHLVHTAYFCKRIVVLEAEFKAYQVFFDENFGFFTGMHTDWLLLNEPELSLITPQTINLRYRELIQLYEDHLVPFVSQDQSKAYDLNTIVHNLNKVRERKNLNKIKKAP